MTDGLEPTRLQKRTLNECSRYTFRHLCGFSGLMTAMSNLTLKGLHGTRPNVCTP
jgi:hypothetical protein